MTYLNALLMRCRARSMFINRKWSKNKMIDRVCNCSMIRFSNNVLDSNSNVIRFSSSIVRFSSSIVGCKRTKNDNRMKTRDSKRYMMGS